ncbi:hypothetical protein GCM10017608_30640 [Agromyces luteolus]|uniref:Transcriptional regulator n=1 Tax=Agromyces luteolus TaxID=88373 RepID=A0A7C9LH71_9MICO|nr:helix-turn-helix domain-containing protein [Agromyces luteolus]MUN07515.1 transcriptional regulator [Agromyces luteolus]GLK29128.1 hypothetical protein GCM10017608_30640 [Agromyces luteolus]
MKHSQARRSLCPINFTLELVGDPWSLLVVRDIVYFGKRTFGEFHSSAEGIARNILAERLDRLVGAGVLTRRPLESDRRKQEYRLTEAGLDLIPLLLAAADWGAAHADETDAPPWWIAYVRASPTDAADLVREVVRSGGSIFSGEQTVVERLTRSGAIRIDDGLRLS